MLFDLNDTNVYDMNFDYFNLNNKDMNSYYKSLNKLDSNKFMDNSLSNENLDLENGFYLGNIFSDTYKPYKNYKSKKINAYSDQQKMLLKIHELDFIINDLNLYLDINPNNARMFELFKKYIRESNELKKKYNEKYQVLELCYDDKNKYTWLDNPWPWDGGYYV